MIARSPRGVNGFAGKFWNTLSDSMDARREAARLAAVGAATPRLLRRLNAHIVLDALRGAEPRRVAEIAEATGLSRVTVDAVTDDLVRLGWISEVTREPSSRRAPGRPARRFAFRADAGYVAGVDIGEMKVRAVVADLEGRFLSERRQDFDRGLDGEQRLDLIRSTVEATLDGAGIGRTDLLAACVGCTGGMDHKTGTVLFTTAFPGLDGVNLRNALRPVLGDAILVENECNLAVIGEQWRGAGAGVQDLICILASERLGAGILVDGRLVRGHAGLAGEMPFLGAYEVESGSEGVAVLVRDLATAAIEEGAETTLRDDLGRTGDELTAEAVFAAAAAGDAVAVDVVHRSVRHAGRAIVTMALVLNPEIVVIGGGVANAGDALLEPLRRQLAEMVRLPPRLEVSPLAERGVLYGAVRHALDHVESRLLDALDEAA
jgi:predicted NBD/HSP70 family sugar kinase